MLKTINKYLNMSIVLAILLGLIGIISIIWPKTSLETFAYVIGSLLLCYGIINFVDSFNVNIVFCLSQMTSSILTFLLGFLIFLNPSIFENLLPIVLGLFFIINGSFKLRLSFILKSFDNKWIWSLLASMLMILCGIILIINPSGTSVVLTTFLGTILVIYAISDSIDMFIFKRKINDFSKYFDNLIK